MPNYFEMNLFGVSDLEMYEKTIGYWSNVYGFKMNVMNKKSFFLRELKIARIT